MPETSSSTSISPRLERIAKLAKQSPKMTFTTLAHHIDIDWLREAYRRTRKSGAPGVDGQRSEEYAADLEGNLQSLLARAKSGTYRAPPVRRVFIPKGDGEGQRPLGVPTFEDKILQRAVAMTLEAVYEQDFLDCSYGFRPKRSAHVVFARRDDAQRVMDVLPKRLGKYNLALHPDKTRLVPFGRPSLRASRRVGRQEGNWPGTFDFLGFTHHWMKSTKGNWIVKLRTATSRVSRTLRRAADWCRRHRHQPVPWQHAQLCRALLGHYGYFSITGNVRVVENVRREVVCIWWKWLNRRSQRRCMPWSRMRALLKRYPLPEPRVMRVFTIAPTV